MAVNASNLVNFGTGGTAIGDVVYSASTLSAPSYLPMVDETAAYLASSYPTLAALYTTPVTAYSTSTGSTPSGAMYDMAYGNGIFVAVATGATATMTSRDGVTWVKRDPFYPAGNASSFFTATLKYITFANGIFVITANGAVNASNTGTQIFVSQDGINWTRTELSSTLTLSNPVAMFSNGVWVIANSSGSNTWRSADNGVTWTIFYPSQTGVGTQARASGNGVLVVGNGQSPNGIRYSTDQGYFWGIATVPAGFFGSGPCIAFGNGIFVAIEGNNGNSTVAASSVDGITWTARTLPASVVWRAVAFGNGLFVAISRTGTTAATSPDGITWTTRVLPVSTFDCTAFCYGGPTNNGFFAGLSAFNSPNTYIKLNVSVAQTTFTLPSMTSTIMKNMLPYIKAT